MKKKIILILSLVSVLALCIVPFSVSAADDLTPVNQELIGYLSNRGQYYSNWRPIGLDYQNPTAIALEPNTTYVIESVPFVTDEYGRIPNGIRFSAFSTQLEIYWSDASNNPSYGVLVVESRLDLNRPMSTLGIYRLYGNVDGYTQGYLNGYDVGFNDGHTSGYTDGENSGFLLGYEEAKQEWYSKGKQEGLQEGLNLAADGDWHSLTSAIANAPIQVMQGLFSFDVLGFDMRGAIGAIVTLCVFVIIIKAVI